MSLKDRGVMDILSEIMRGCIVAPQGKKLVVSDLSNIEGRVQAWLAGEQWKIDAFKAFDQGAGHDLYKLAYAKSFGIEPQEVTKDQRQIGKVQELALAYEGGVGAFLTFATLYRIDLEVMGAQAFAQLPASIHRDAQSFYDWSVKQKRSTFDLSRQAFVVCEGFKRSWRAAHPKIVNMWSELGGAVIAAIKEPGAVFEVRTLRVRCDAAWLRIKLPSGRYLCYPSPKIEDGQITYWGIDQYSRTFQKQKTYSGKLFENVCQAVAADVLTNSMAAIECAGYLISLSVHDELICESLDTEQFNATHLSTLLATVPEWAPDMPLAAAGFEAYRYKKE